MHVAAMRNDFPTVKLLFGAGVNMHYKAAGSGDIPLHAAVRGRNNNDMVAFMVETGQADVNAVNAKGKSVLQESPAGSGIPKYLKSKGAEKSRKVTRKPRPAPAISVPEAMEGRTTQQGRSPAIAGLLPSRSAELNLTSHPYQLLVLQSVRDDIPHALLVVLFAVGEAAHTNPSRTARLTAPVTLCTWSFW
ncbi:MAG: ankyrin repeat domain-containing protein [Flavobacteriales bacterium]|nr:ankyrin repeat domain-containing protein [Flavobacteriales bacterium]